MSKESVLITALEKIIEMNRQNAEDQYGNADKAERWSCVTVAREAIKKYNTETKEPFIKEEPKDHIPDIGKMIGEDELKEKFKHAINESDFHVPEFISNVKLESEDYSEILEHETNILANCCTKIAKQYANSKLEQLEKLCDKYTKYQNKEYMNAFTFIRKFKSKISSLKQQ